MRAATYLPALALAAAALALAGCGSHGRAQRATGSTLTVYVSLPRQGVDARVAESVAAGMRLALADAHGRAGGKRVRLVELDNTKPGGETWDPSAVEANAKRAADDPTAIAYLGELDDGASAISVPVTNDAGILQVSPADGLTSLTRDEPGAPLTTGPERYYPSGARSFLRLVPDDYLEAGTLVGLAAQRGAHRIALVQDERLTGRELATQARYAAAKLGVAVADVAEARADAQGYPALARRLAGERPDAVVYTGLGDANSGRLLSAVARALPGVPLYGASGLATAEPAPPGLPPATVVKPALAASAYGPRARRVLSRLERQRGAPAAPESLYGYESMRVVLDALNAAGRNSADRATVVRAALAPRVRRSVLGDYRVVAPGGVSTRRFGAYRRTGDSLDYLGPRDPPAPVR